MQLKQVENILTSVIEQLFGQRPSEPEVWVLLHGRSDDVFVCVRNVEVGLEQGVQWCAVLHEVCCILFIGLSDEAVSDLCIEHW